MLSGKKIDSLIEQNKDLLESLEEFDRTGKLSRATYKEKVTFTLDMDLMRVFRSYCGDHNLKMSNVVEKLIKEELGIK
jgi:hypothetical protein